MRTLAIDLGARRVGLALSDEGARFATPLDVLEVTAEQQILPQVIQLIRKEDVRRIVIGLPLNMDDTVGPMAKQTIKCGRELAKQAAIPIIFVDERLSSFAAEQSLNERKRSGERLTRKDKKQRLDALAAARFLQDFLDGKLSPVAVDDL